MTNLMHGPILCGKCGRGGVLVQSSGLCGPCYAAAEADRYDALYRGDPTYRMGAGRRSAVERLLAEGTLRASYLDVGTGRGEAIVAAAALGYRDVTGTDGAPAVCWDGPGAAIHGVICCMAWELPFDDGEFETVSCFDVLEHLPTAYLGRTVAEIARVCGRRLIIAAASKPDIRNGVDLHISAMPAAEWSFLFHRTLGPGWDLRPRRDAPTPTSAVWEALRATPVPGAP